MKTTAEVVKLDKSLPLICTESGSKTRAKFCPELSKKHIAVAIGDELNVNVEDDLEVAIINEILPRRTRLTRNDPVNRKKEQVLAANFDAIAICVVAGQENFNHLTRMLAIACNAGVPATLVYTKCDLHDPSFECIEELLPTFKEVVCASIANNNLTITLPNKTEHPNPSLTSWDGKTTVLLGKSGVGKSTLINALAGKTVCKQGEVRAYDSKGRHTTVARSIIDAGQFGRIVDMPGVRSLGLINCEKGLEAVFHNIFELSQNCKFRDCKHKGELGCAVKDNVSEQLLASFHELTEEDATNSTRLHR